MSDANRPANLAPVGRRIEAFVFDAVVVFFGSLVLQLLLGGMSGLENPIFSVVRFEMGTVVYLINLVLIVAYFVVMRTRLSGQTLGARAAHVRVVASGGGQLDPATALVRLLVALVSMLVIFLGYLPALFDPQRRTLQDRVARTLVVRESVTLNTHEQP
ncbi:RDD family protein [Ferrimicrobium acidiphilum]|uniref:RDD family protein n=1 Tax=Ferrimicrobium acidiphilum TaxID=121039 RepID=UPI0023F37B1F|nr:RDD family protein [Ferrimicrobium acidiphilum]